MLIKDGAPFTKSHLPLELRNFVILKNLRYINVIHRHSIRVLLQCLAPGTSKICTKHGVSISDIRGWSRAVFDHVFDHHIFKVSLRWVTNHSLGFMRNFGCGDLFLGKTFKIVPDGF